MTTQYQNVAKRRLTIQPTDPANPKKDTWDKSLRGKIGNTVGRVFDFDKNVKSLEKVLLKTPTYNGKPRIGSEEYHKQREVTDMSTPAGKAKAQENLYGRDAVKSLHNYYQKNAPGQGATNRQLRRTTGKAQRSL